MSLREDAVTTSDGAELHYRIRSGRDPLVLLHGLGCDASMWDGVVEMLPSGIGLLIPEVRGHGMSSLGWRVPSVDLWADDVMGLLSRERIEKPSIAGLSMGGYVAFAIEAGYRGRARACAFISTTASADDEAGKRRRAGGIATIGRLGWRAFADEMIPKWLNDRKPGFTPRRDHLHRMLERAGDAGLPPALMALAGRPDRRELLPSIAVPTIVIAGRGDALIPPDRSRELAAAIAGARLHVLDDVAHLSAMEAPQEVARLLASL